MENKNYEPLGSKMYFEQVADRYTERSASLLWRWQRHRESIAVFSLLGDVEGLNILDLGCGAGYYTRCCLDRGVGEVTAVDEESFTVSCPGGAILIKRVQPAGAAKITAGQWVQETGLKVGERLA